jgi:hypothetical protein
MIPLERERPDAIPGIDIELPDSEVWTFAMPEARVATNALAWSFGPDVPPDIDKILSHKLWKLSLKWHGASTDAEKAQSTLEIAWFLLARNYEITPEEFEGILGRMAELTEEAQKELLGKLGNVVLLTLNRAVMLRDTV